MDTLEHVLNLQRELMERLNVPTNREEQPLRSQLVKDVLIMLASEVQEALNPLTVDSKPWKHALEEDLLQEFHEEVIDILFLYAELMVILGFDADYIRRRYEDKLFYILTARLGESEATAKRIVFGD
jgi:hypothetical protein